MSQKSQLQHSQRLLLYKLPIQYTAFTSFTCDNLVEMRFLEAKFSSLPSHVHTGHGCVGQDSVGPKLGIRKIFTRLLVLMCYYLCPVIFC